MGKLEKNEVRVGKYLKKKKKNHGRRKKIKKKEKIKRNKGRAV